MSCGMGYYRRNRPNEKKSGAYLPEGTPWDDVMGLPSLNSIAARTPKEVEFHEKSEILGGLLICLVINTVL